MIWLGIAVAALGLVSLVCLLVAITPERREPLDELEVRRRQRPRTGWVDRVDEEAS